MKENARQGFWSGSRPPLGYRVYVAEQRGAKLKKKLEIDPINAEKVGFSPARDYRYIETNRALRALHPEVVAGVIDNIRSAGASVEREEYRRLALLAALVDRDPSKRSAGLAQLPPHVAELSPFLVFEVAMVFARVHDRLRSVVS